MDSVALNFGLVLLFVLIGGFFAASEIALVSLRESQVNALSEHSRRGARVAELKADSNRFLSAVQVGVTVAGFFASSYGAATLAVDLQPVLSDWGLPTGAAATTALIVVTAFVSYLSLVFGELVPKRLAMQRTEGVALVTAGALDKVATAFRPIIWLLSKSTNGVVRLLGITPGADAETVSEAELREMVRTSEQLSTEERQLVGDAFQASDRILGEVMVPRTEVDFLDSNLSLSDAAAEIADKPHSRYPIIAGSVDDVVGFVHVRDLYAASHATSRDHTSLGDLTRPIAAFPNSKSLLSTLAGMRRGGGHLAVVIDEYGGTDGIVTVEDLVEEVVGEIHDEYDPSTKPVTRCSDGSVEADGLLHRSEVAEHIGLSLPEGSYDTLAGFVLSHFDQMPAEGDSIDALGHRFAVQEMDGNRIARVRITSRDRHSRNDGTV